MTTSGSEAVQLWHADTLDPLGDPLPLPHDRDPIVAPNADRTEAVVATRAGSAIIRQVTQRSGWQPPRIAGRNLTLSEWRDHLGNRPYETTYPQWPRGQ